MTTIKGIKQAIGAAFLASTLLFTGVSQADNNKPEYHQQKEHSAINLSHDLKEILNQEMNGIEAGMKQIITAISAGDWQTITATGKKIKNSFILKQKLSSTQLKELHTSLPTDFVAMDKSFHKSAEKMAHAALQKDGELVNFYFYKLHNQCIKCHSKYATERFPGLKETAGEAAEHH